MVKTRADSDWRYRLTRFAVRNVLFPYWQPQLRGLDNLPSHGPVIVAGNHPTMLDAFIVAASIPRRLDFLAGPYVLDLPVIGPWLRKMGVMAVSKASMFEALRRLRQGGRIGIFPEGRNSRPEGLWDFQPGVAVLAKRSGAPVVPVGAWGHQEALAEGAAYVSGTALRLNFGEPLICGRDESIESFLARLTEAVRALMQPQVPLVPLRHDWRFNLARLFWIPFSWLVFRLGAKGAKASAASSRS